MIAIKNGRIITPDEVIDSKTLLIYLSAPHCKVSF